MKKNPPPPPPPLAPSPHAPQTQNLKENKSRHIECMLSLAIGCMKFLFSKLFITVFDLG